MPLPNIIGSTVTMISSISFFSKKVVLRNAPPPSSALAYPISSSSFNIFSISPDTHFTPSVFFGFLFKVKQHSACREGEPERWQKFFLPSLLRRVLWKFWQIIFYPPGLSNQESVCRFWLFYRPWL